MKSHQISIIDIAKELGISKSTVSRALLGHSSVKEKTRIAVLELAAKLDYQRNTLALSLANEEMKLSADSKFVFIAPAAETTTAINTFFNFLRLDKEIRKRFDRKSFKTE